MRYDSYSLGDRLRELRIRSGMSQEALAERLGVERKTISKIENGSMNIRVEVLVGYMTIFDCSADHLLQNNSYGIKKTSTGSIEEELATLPAEWQQYISKTVKDMIHNIPA